MMASRNFNAKQALEKGIKDLYAEIQPEVVGVAATATLDLTVDVVLESVAIAEARNGTTFELVVEAAAANDDDEVLVAFTGDSDAIVCTVTPNDGTNNPGDAAEAVLDLSTDITLTSVAAGTPRNGESFELVVNAAAPNPLATVLVAFTGTAAAIVCTVTPNDGTNNAATPVSLDEDELAELINSGVVVGKTITLTDASSLRILQTAAGGAAADALTAGDDQVILFADGTDIAVDLTEEELVELINSGVVVGKTIVLTDGDDLRILQTATGGDSSALSASDDQEVIFAGGVDEVEASFISGVGFASVTRTDVGEYLIVLQDTYYGLKHADAIWKRDTAEDISFQILDNDVNVSSAKSFVLQVLTGANPVDPNAAGSIVLKLELDNSSV